MFHKAYWTSLWNHHGVQVHVEKIPLHVVYKHTAFAESGNRAHNVIVDSGNPARPRQIVLVWVWKILY